MKKEINTYLNQLLADTQQLLCLTRQVHWYMRGERFSVLHPMLDDYIDEYNENIDNIAELLIILGGSPLSTLKEYQDNTKLELSSGDYNIKINEQLSKLIKGLQYYDKLLSEGLDLADKYNNQPLDNLLSDMKALTQKHIWMLSAEIGEASKVYEG